MTTLKAKKILKTFRNELLKLLPIQVTHMLNTTQLYFQMTLSFWKYMKTLTLPMMSNLLVYLKHLYHWRQIVMQVDGDNFLMVKKQPQTTTTTLIFNFSFYYS
jgi:hypothetical protein